VGKKGVFGKDAIAGRRVPTVGMDNRPAFMPRKGILDISRISRV